MSNNVPTMTDGYAYSSLRSLENVMIVPSEAQSAKFQGYVSCDGRRYAKFRIGKKSYYQLPSAFSNVRMFTMADVKDGRIYADRSELLYAPTEWQKLGLQQTATGYGRKLNSALMIHFEGKFRRIYITQFSNAGTAWFNYGDKRIVVS